ncbi:sep-tRNA:Sec-tRNA synthase, partial [Haematococcus lacustris]
MLWARCVSGTRVAGTGRAQNVAGITFQNYGAHHDTYPHTYLTAAAAIGGSRREVDEFCARLLRCYKEMSRKSSK